MTDQTRPTRRSVLRVSAAVAGGGALAGCTSIPGSDDGSNEAGGDSGGDSYSVTMEPVGTVEFDGVPETWVANNASWADMGTALGREPPAAVWMTSRYHTRYYDEIPDVEVDTEDVVALYQDGVDKERFYELNADVHVIDPNFLMNRFKGWDESDIEEVGDRIAPFFGNSIFSTGYEWHQDYPYLSLYEAFGKLAEVFQATDRYDAFVDLHDEFQASLDEIVPEDESERPTVAIMWAGSDEPEEFSPYLIGEGTSFKQWRDLGVRDAFAETDVRDFHSSRGSVDYETLLEIDPDVLLFRGHEAKTREEFQDTVVAFMEDHDVASDLAAVQSGDVYRGGPLYQGPITNLVLTERAAGQVYGVDEELFDRQQVADIVNGDF
ncbi:ABC transporter substrate-binding protein [Natronomonas salina]|uniref:ABC transporter substrate-binding protein n=1 Tax=Natronomonas salina TaxID=1710540 RepID=UPI0015B71E7A|nr:ABC transporter substrate-binding protein [Natronomonas salina]QLD87542.1 ABC transporter substrate-binding protein [Natronomonas salina]